MTALVGGCLCGDLRFTAEGPPRRTLYCHCHSCRRQTGAPVAGFATCDRAGFAWTAGSAVAYRSSPKVIRRFCGRCGTPVTYESSDFPGQLDVAISTFDDPGSLPAPAYHCFFAERIGWFDTRDELPRHPGDSGN